MHSAGSSVNPQNAATALAADAEAMGVWTRENQLRVSATKFQLIISLNNAPLPLDRWSKLLGLTFYTKNLFIYHIYSITEKATQWIKALSETNRGHNRETRREYSLFILMLPICGPKYFQFQHQKLTDHPKLCSKNRPWLPQKACVGNLHTETWTLHSNDSWDFQCKQNLVSALCPTHPFNPTVSQTGPTCKKYTLQSKYHRYM